MCGVDYEYVLYLSEGYGFCSVDMIVDVFECEL